MRYIALFLFACTACIAQKKFTVIDAETKKPVPYASIDLNNGFGIYSGEDGTVAINDTLVKNVTVTSIGYRDHKSTVDAIGDFLSLQPEPIALQEVVITGKKTKRRESVVKPKKHQDSGSLFMSSVGLQYAFLVAADKKDAYLSKITLPLMKIAFESEGRPGTFNKVAFHTLVKIELLENNHGEPGARSYDFEQLALVANTANDTQFDIALDEEIPVAENGMFVQLTILGKADEKGSLTGGLGYTSYQDTDGVIKKMADYCQPNFPLLKRPNGVLTFVREPFSDNRLWRIINEPHLHRLKQYPSFSIGFGYSIATYN